LYIQIAETLVQQVSAGTLRSGDRVPSLRQLSRERSVSVSTASQAYMWLENRGYLEARPQSGFYVRTPLASLIPEPQFEPSPGKPTDQGKNAVLAGIIEAATVLSNGAFDSNQRRVTGVVAFDNKPFAVEPQRIQVGGQAELALNNSLECASHAVIMAHQSPRRMCS
jgi:DNA-binding transcriptional MocR family regulator